MGPGLTDALAVAVGEGNSGAFCGVFLTASSIVDWSIDLEVVATSGVFEVREEETINKIAGTATAATPIIERISLVLRFILLCCSLSIIHNRMRQEAGAGQFWSP